MRSRRKEWKNGRGGRWSTRIIWFDDHGGSELGGDIRLALEDCERKVNLFPSSKEVADHIWFMFKNGSPADGQRIPFVADLLELLEKGGVK